MFRNKDKKKKDFDEFIEDEEFEKILREMEKIVGDAFNTALVCQEIFDKNEF